MKGLTFIVHQEVHDNILTMEHNNIRFRRANVTDLRTIVEMLADDQFGLQREDPQFPIASEYQKAFTEIEADSNQLLAVAEDAGFVVATLQLSFIPGLARKGTWRGQIEAVRVASSHRNSGLGQLMIEWAITQSEEKGCGLIQLTTDKLRPDAHRFYERLGFKATHEGYKLTLLD
jgi:GNAT superfamily N-acetyltransferase